MTRTNRLVLLAVAVAIAIVAFIALRPTEDSSPTADRGADSAATTEPAGNAPATAEATQTPSKPRRPKVPLLTGAKVRKLSVKQGQTVRFAARSPEDDEIHVHGYDRSLDAPAGRTVRMSFRATITGIFEIEFEHAGKEIAQLKVEP